MTRPSRVAALALAVATALAVAGCTQPRELTPEDRAAAAALADELRALPGVTEAEVTPKRDERGSADALVVVRFAEIPDAGLAIDAVNRATEVAHASALVKSRDFPITGVALGTVAGTPFQGAFFRDGELMDQQHAQALTATLAVARTDGIGRAFVSPGGEDPDEDCLVLAEGASAEQVATVPLSAVPQNSCRQVRRVVTSLPEQAFDAMPTLPDSATGIVQLQTTAKPGTTPGPIPVEAAASLITDPSLVSVNLAGSVPYVTVDNARTIYGPGWDPSNKNTWPTASAPPSEDAVRAALEALREHPGGITVRLELPIGVTFRVDAAGTISVDRPETTIPPTDQAYLELIQRVAASLN